MFSPFFVIGESGESKVKIAPTSQPLMPVFTVFTWLLFW